MAANRAYLAGLGLGPQAIASGAVPAVPPNHPLTLAAARRLANTAALTQAQNQACSGLHHTSLLDAGFNLFAEIIPLQDAKAVIILCTYGGSKTGVCIVHGLGQAFGREAH